MEHDTTVDTIDTDTTDTTDTDTTDTTDTDSGAELVDELLIEEISIDGMCGVY